MSVRGGYKWSLQTDITEDDHESFFDLQLYVPSFQDCLNFIHQGKVSVPRDTLICTVDETEIQTGHCFIKLSEETYETLLSELHNFEDLLPEGKDCEEGSEKESDEESNSNALVEARPLRTLSGRMVFRPKRLGQWTETTTQTIRPLCIDQTVCSRFRRPASQYSQVR